MTVCFPHWEMPGGSCDLNHEHRCGWQQQRLQFGRRTKVILDTWDRTGKRNAWYPRILDRSATDGWVSV